MTKNDAIDLKIAIKEDFDEEFGIDLVEEDFTENEFGFEVDFRDYDIEKYDLYRHSSLIESVSKECEDGKEFLYCYTNLTYEDYFTPRN